MLILLLISPPLGKVVDYRAKIVGFVDRAFDVGTIGIISDDRLEVVG